MKIENIAKILGSRGGQARAKRLSAAAKKEIASLGGKAKAESYQKARLIWENFLYVKAINALAPKSKPVKRYKTWSKPLPGIYISQKV